jgi:hypothetical protein
MFNRFTQKVVTIKRRLLPFDRRIAMMPGIAFVSRGCVGLVLLLILLTACNAAPQATPIPPTPIPDDALAPSDLPGYGLIPGEVRLSLIGAVTGETATGNETPPIEYSAGVNGMRHPGTNESGNVGLLMRAQLTSGDEALLLLEFPGDIGIGTHQIGTNSDLNPAAVGAVLRVAGQAPFNERVSGTLTLDFINRRSINGELDVTLLDTTGRSVTARGAFHRVPYFSREEYSVELGGIYEALASDAQFSKGIQGASRFITLRFTARRAFAEPVNGTLTLTARDYLNLQPGEYDLFALDSPLEVRVSLNDEVLTVTEGSVLFVRTLDTLNGVQQSVWQGAVNLTLQTEAGETTLTAIFNHFDLY